MDLKGEVYEGCRPDTQMTLEAEPANTSHRDWSFEPSSRWSLPRQVSDNATNQELAHPRDVFIGRFRLVLENSQNHLGFVHPTTATCPLTS